MFSFLRSLLLFFVSPAWLLEDARMKRHLRNVKGHWTRKQEQDRRDQRNTYRLNELKAWIGQPVICLTNEVQNPVVGYGKEIRSLGEGCSTHLVVTDYLTQTDLIVSSVICAFNQQTLKHVANTDKNALIKLIYGRGSQHEFVKAPLDRVDDYVTIQETLRRNGFYVRLAST